MNTPILLTVTKDVSANQKILKRLERDGYIKLYVNDMELPAAGSKITGRNSLPFGFKCDDPNCKCHEGVGGFGDGSEEKPHSYWWMQRHEKILARLQNVIGAGNRRDCKQVLHHHINGRDVFVTEDSDILNAKDTLLEEFSIVVLTPKELASRFQI